MTVDALQALEKWKRKHYYARLIGPGHVQPGEGWYVELKAAGRKVVLSEEDERYDWQSPPGLSRLILDALEMWHADPRPKPHQALVRADATPVASGDVVKTERWGSDAIHMVWMFAANEAEVYRKLMERGVAERDVLAVWEMQLVGEGEKYWSH